MRKGYTPGPWLAAAKPSSVVGWPVVGELGSLIADVCTMTAPGVPIPKEAFANTRLIAAAPDLVEAAVALLADVRDENRDGGGWITDPIHIDDVRKLRAAIAKAIGDAS